MYIYTHIYIYVHIYTYTYMHIYIYIVLKLGLFEGAPCSRCEVGLCTVPRTTIKSADMVDEVNVHSVSGILVEFLSLRPVPLR